jgi:prolyl oligopeptidase
MPGHHLQITLQMEIEDVPHFRKYSWFTAYGEGWALYAESLGKELGMYADPYNDFGRLIFEMWRACRLVVDTGIHSKGWTRQRAIDFMQENAATSDNNVETEVDRYIVWPGQALAYKIGELKIKSLRQKAKEKLGEKFDIRQFHDVVLGNGTIPLNVLEANVNEWINAKIK